MRGSILAALFLTSALDGVEWSASDPANFTPKREILLSIAKVVEWAAGTVKIKKMFLSLPGIEPLFLHFEIHSVVTVLTSVRLTNVKEHLVMNAAIFCKTASCGPHVNRRFGAMYYLRL
jgi:hypothetical protein